MAARFRASYRGIGKMIRSPEMQHEMRRRANRVKAQAEATAPVYTGDYKSSFSVESGPRGGWYKDRAYGRVVNSDQAAFYVEFGTSRTRAHHTLRRALTAAGG